jgi:hypothetical protein
MRNKIRDSLKNDNGPGHKESRQCLPGMAKVLAPRKNNYSLQRSQAGSMAMKELRSASSGFILTPESMPSAEAVEDEKQNPKVEGKKQEYKDQGQNDGKEEYDSPNQLSDAHKDKFKDQSRASKPEAMAKNVPIANSH